MDIHRGPNTTYVGTAGGGVWKTDPRISNAAWVVGSTVVGDQLWIDRRLVPPDAFPLVGRAAFGKAVPAGHRLEALGGPPEENGGRRRDCDFDWHARSGRPQTIGKAPRAIPNMPVRTACVFSRGSKHLSMARRGSPTSPPYVLPRHLRISHFISGPRPLRCVSVFPNSSVVDWSALCKGAPAVALQHRFTSRIERKELGK